MAADQLLSDIETEYTVGARAFVPSSTGDVGTSVGVGVGLGCSTASWLVSGTTSGLGVPPLQSGDVGGVRTFDVGDCASGLFSSRAKGWLWCSGLSTGFGVYRWVARVRVFRYLCCC
jgi:hypothetical protein